MNKKCAKCSIFKEATEKFFPKSKSTIDKLSSWCKDCYSEYSKSHKSSKAPKMPKEPKEKMVPCYLVVDGHKKCSKCLVIKLATEDFFPKNSKIKCGLASDCLECRHKYQKENRDKDPEKYKERQRKSYRKNIEKRKKSAKAWVKKNREKINAKSKEKRKEDPMFRVASNLRRAVSGCIEYKGFRKNSNLSKYLGCNSQEFKIYLESLFQPGMTWDNYGHGNNKWHLDHTIPLISAKNIEELYKLSHFTNIRPMWQKYNIAKKDMLPEKWQLYKEQNGIDELIPPLGATKAA